MSHGYGGAVQVPRLQPSVLWAQRRDSVFVTVDIKDAADVHFQLEEQCLDFTAKGGEDGSAYAFHLDLYAPIRREESKFSTKRCPTSCFFSGRALRTLGLSVAFRKTSELLGDVPKAQTQADSDEEEEKGAFDTGDLEGMDFGDLTKEDVEGSDDRDSILADLDEDIAVLTDEEAREDVAMINEC